MVWFVIRLVVVGSLSSLLQQLLRVGAERASAGTKHCVQCIPSPGLPLSIAITAGCVSTNLFPCGCTCMRRSSASRTGLDRSAGHVQGSLCSVQARFGRRNSFMTHHEQTPNPFAKRRSAAMRVGLTVLY